jgi:hypothetical protein
MEIPAGYNSFRRMLSYRIGDRFGLSHTTSDQLNEVRAQTTVVHLRCYG